MSDRIAWFISGACLSALLLTTTGFKTVPDGPGALGAAASMVTVMSEWAEPDVEDWLYTVPEGFVLAVTDWRDDQCSFYAHYPDSTVRRLDAYFPIQSAGSKILRTGILLPEGTELSWINEFSQPRPFGFTGQLYRE